MLDFADLIALNKFDKRGAPDALRDVRKQYKRNHKLFDTDDSKIPVFGIIASQFNDLGMNQLYKAVMNTIAEKTGAELKSDYHTSEEMSEKVYIIPPGRTRYLSEIAENNRGYDKWVEEQSTLAQKLYALHESLQMIKDAAVAEVLKKQYETLERNFDGNNKKLLEDFPVKVDEYKKDFYEFKVREKVLKIKTYSESLSHNRIPKVAFPKYKAWGDLLKWILQENVPGEFPYTAGVFRFKREGEDPTRMFAGEGCPERTNKRFHYVSLGMPAKRLSTAFDSVTLYGNDPDLRPDIYGKIGNSGVSVCCLDDAKKLYSGFNLCNPATSVSMTINGSCIHPVRLLYECCH